MKNIFYNLAYLLFGYKKQERLKLKDIEKGENVRIEWNRAKGGIAVLKCLNNDPKTKKILLEVRWSNYKENKLQEHEQILFSYKDKELKNYHILNTCMQPSGNEEDVNSLKEKIKEAIAKEDYEEVDRLQKKLDKLSKK